jgi:Uma2 family endonuclease
MTAEPITDFPPYFAPRWQPDPVRQKRANYNLEDVLKLPDGAPRVELADGRMLPLTPPRRVHQRVARRICQWLEEHAPPDRYCVELALGVALGFEHSREPDVLLLDADVSQDNHFFSPDDVPLVVEVVSPSTRRIDRFDKPRDYAKAGIKNYWRVELEPEVHIFAYRLGRVGEYEAVADSAKLLKLVEPFPIELPISEITW